MLVLEDLPAATRAALVAKLSETLAQFVVARNWLSPDRAVRVAGEARDRSTVNIAARSRGDDMRGLVRHLRATGQLTAGLILRALLSGNLELFDHALAELSGLPQSRVSALLHDRGGASLHALLRRAGLPELTFAAFQVALEVNHETGFADSAGGAARLRRRMVERVLTHCETDQQAAEPLLILLRRFATELAREEARMFCDELAGRGGRRADPSRSDRGVEKILGSSFPRCAIVHLRARASANPESHSGDFWIAGSTPWCRGTTVPPQSAGAMLGARMASRCSGRSRLACARYSSATPRSCRLSSLAVLTVSSLVRSRTIA